MGTVHELVFDVETHPTRNAAEARAMYQEAVTKQPAKNLPREVKESWDTEDAVHERFRAVWAKTSVDVLLAEVLCVCWWADGETGSVDCMGDEAAGLRRVAAAFEGMVGPETVLVGHNIAGFDIPVLVNGWHRCDIVPPTWWPRVVGKRVRGGRIHDTMEHAPSGNGLGLVSLDAVSRAYGLPAAKRVVWEGAPMDGSRVLEAFEAGERELILRYCLADVEAERALYERQTHGGQWTGSTRHAAVVDELARVDAAGLEEAMGKILKYDILHAAGYVPR